MTVKKVWGFVGEVVVTAVVFTLMVWVWKAAVGREGAFDWSMALQGAVFAVIYVPVARRARRKKAAR